MAEVSSAHEIGATGGLLAMEVEDTVVRVSNFIKRYKKQVAVQGVE
jgi:hypothetical protein